MNRLRHVRRPTGSPLRGWWHLRCDCGWSGKTPTTVGPRVKTGEEIQRDLDQAFVGHLPAGERSLYLLVDQRQKAVEVEAEDGAEPRVEMIATGNFIMPEGRPCVLTSWREQDGVRYGRYLDPAIGEEGELPVGEIRTADHRVIKLDAPA